MTLCLTNPLWVLKTRMCVVSTSVSTMPVSASITSGTATGSLSDYTTFRRAIQTIYQQEGLKGFYRGFLPGILGVTHGGIQFMLYEKSKQYLLQRKQEQYQGSLLQEPVHLTTAQIMFLSSFSKVMAALLTYPYQVVRSRLQDNRGDTLNVPYRGVKDVVTRTFK